MLYGRVKELLVRKVTGLLSTLAVHQIGLNNKSKFLGGTMIFYGYSLHYKFPIQARWYQFYHKRIL